MQFCFRYQSELKSFLQKGKGSSSSKYITKARISNVNAEENDFVLALSDLEEAQKLDPEDPQIQKEIKLSSLQLQKMRSNDLKISKKIIKESKEGEELNYPQLEQQVSSSDSESDESYSEFWKEKDFSSLHYDLSYEVDENLPAPVEAVELGKFIELRGRENLMLLEKTGKVEKARQLREQLAMAMAAKSQLEKIGRLDFSRPNQQFLQKAKEFGLNLEDPSVQEEFKLLQAQNLSDVKTWLKKSGWKMPKNKTRGKQRRNQVVPNHDDIIDEALQNSEQNAIRDDKSASFKLTDILMIATCVIFILISFYFKIVDYDL